MNSNASVWQGVTNPPTLDCNDTMTSLPNTTTLPLYCGLEMNAAIFSTHTLQEVTEWAGGRDDIDTLSEQCKEEFEQRTQG